jgi:isoleucyl-tRNA synthetase
MFKEVDPRPDFVQIENDIAELWRGQDIPDKYLHRNDAASERFSFLDGPITANNPMGVHHAWGRTLKDIFQRHQTMKGRAQRYQNGFDCQGLWVEVEVERELGLKNKKDIEDLVPGDQFASLAKFVELCKERVRKYSAVQTEQSRRLGYWMNWDHSYFTMADHNNYAIWDFLAKCHQKGWVYQGHDSVPWCPRCGTAISQHEILTEEYQELTHTSVYLALPLVEKMGESLLVWTTTPWTIPANICVAVNPDLEYSLVVFEGGKYWLASARVEAIFGKDTVVEQKLPGLELVNLHYQGPFDDLPIYTEPGQSEHFHEVLSAPDLVSEEDGTGLVHIAPAAGGEDFALMTREYKYPDLVIPVVDEAGAYLEGYGALSSQNAHQDPDLIIDRLGEFLFRKEPFTHRYPTCWRCKSELIWRVVDEWYIAMDRPDPEDAKKRTYREQMMDVAREINWIPGWGLERELDWLKNMHDWLISKKRYWGLALPIYPCECGGLTVVSSRTELQEKSASGWDKFDGHSPHRPWVDQVQITCPACGKPVERITDVGNPWLDAGIVSFSTLFPVKEFGPDGNLADSDGGYRPIEKYFREWFPADLVTEAFPGQFKNWFYALIAMSTVMDGHAPFKNLLGHGLVRDEHGEEMHKSKGNSIEFNEAAETIGADVMRWLYAGQNPEYNVNFGKRPADEVRRRVFLMLWNSYNYFTTYVSEGFDPEAPLNSENVLDRWLVARLDQVITQVDEGLSAFDTPRAIRELESFLEDLSTWYIRRSRRRFSTESADRGQAERHLYEALINVTKLIAPITPFLAEELYQNLVVSVQKEAPESVHLVDFPVAGKVDEKILEQMSELRSVVTVALARRAEAGVKLRQPLASAAISGISPLDKEITKILLEELNVKSIKHGTEKGGLEVVLDTELTPELEQEGLFRELVRQGQALRKEMGLSIADRVSIDLSTDDKQLLALIKNMRSKLLNELRATEIDSGKAEDAKEILVNGHKLRVKITRA